MPIVYIFISKRVVLFKIKQINPFVVKFETTKILLSKEKTGTFPINFNSGFRDGPFIPFSVRFSFFFLQQVNFYPL